MSSLLAAIDVCWSVPFTLYDAVFSRGSVSVLQLREWDNGELPYECVRECVFVCGFVPREIQLAVSQQETSLCFSKDDDYIFYPLQPVIQYTLASPYQI